MKKYYLIALLAIVLLLGGAYVKLFVTQAGFHRSIDTETGVFVLENINNADIKIIIAKTDKITIDLNGDEDSIDKVRLFTSKGNAGFGLSDEWQKLSGTITVPEGILLDIRLSEDSNIVVNDSDGKQDINANSFLVDTSEVSSINIQGASGDLFVDGWGDALIWDTENWDFFNGESGGGEDESEGGGEDENDSNYESSTCSIGPQSVRNYCCERENQYEQTAPCSGIAKWVFNNASRLCEYQCHIEDEEEGGAVDCSIGSQAERDSCCTQQNTGNTIPECIGQWAFDNVSRLCAYNCFDEDELEEYFGGDDDNGGGGGEINRFCEDFDTDEEMNECCDYNLKNELSIGPRPGFPDCIGKWYFNQEDGCSFRCAEYHEMQQILRELKEQAAENIE